MLENIATCENRGKQRESNDYWKSIKTFLKKKTRDDAKKTKIMTEIKYLTKDFTSYKIRYKSLRKRK